MTASLRVSFEASRHPRLPANARVHLNAAMFQIVDWIVSEDPPQLQRQFVAYDVDRDEGSLDVLSAVNYLNPQIRANIVAVAESKGRIAIYYGDLLTRDKAERVLGEACYKALYPRTKWTPDIIFVPMSDGVLDRSRLPENSPQHAPLLAAPQRFQYGLIDLRKDGGRRDGAM